MNTATAAIELKVTQDDLNRATAKWNTMSGDDHWKYIAPLSNSVIRNTQVSFVYITAAMKKDGLI